MKIVAVLCGIAAAVLADEAPFLPLDTQAAARHSSLYDPHFDPPSNLAYAKPLSHFPEHHREYACTMDGKLYYGHGELFRISYETRCVTYRCEYGSYQIYQEGCIDISVQRCVPVGYSWSVQCHNFLCTKTVENGMLIYDGIRNQIACYDQMTNSCKREHEFFAYVDANGVRRNKCTCKIIPGATEIVCFGDSNRVNYVLQQK